MKNGPQLQNPNEFDPNEETRKPISAKSLSSSESLFSSEDEDKSPSNSVTPVKSNPYQNYRKKSSIISINEPSIHDKNDDQPIVAKILEPPKMESKPDTIESAYDLENDNSTVPTQHQEEDIEDQ